MTTDNWFAAICFLAVYVMGLILLDTAHRARIAELKAVHREQVSGLRTYIRTLSRDRKWLEAELAKVTRERELAERTERAFDPFTTTSNADPAHIQWLPPWPAAPNGAEEYRERD